MMANIEEFIDKTIQRLLQVVEEETAVLKAKTAANLQDFNLRKSQVLYDLSRAVHRLDAQTLGPATLERLRSLRVALQQNQSALSVHLQAVREIADTVAQAIQEAESDGTYAPPFNHIGGSA